MDTIFIADVHLDEDRPEKLELFIKLLRGPALRARAVYILGDLFENFWLGNDDKQPPNEQIIAELKNYTRAGRQLYIIRGNRDLMLDAGISELTGADMLPDLYLVELEGNKVLLTHGDLLCTRDHKYQRFRAFMNFGIVRWTFLHLPVSVRQFLVRKLTPAFKQSSSKKKPEIMDVDPETVTGLMDQYGVTELIHGHTHRPAIHELTIGNKPGRRIVLGDWYEDELILVCRGETRNLVSVQEYINSMS